MMHRSNRWALAAALLATLGASGCAAPVGPVSVTRFHVDQAPLGHGPIAVQPAPDMDPQSLEYRDYAVAVSRELARIGYAPTLPAVTPAYVTQQQVALVSFTRETLTPPARKPVSVGVGGNAGSYGSGLGVGVGINFSGAPKAQVRTQMQVRIRDSATGQTVWEGRANFTVSASSPLANSSLGAAKMAEALFKGFPGESGRTIEVR